ncbi:MAG TPA: serine hydrolase [Rhizomicrobium sp.]|jgi:CubicO group peptidase (beta-lactamase class C family)
MVSPISTRTSKAPLAAALILGLSVPASAAPPADLDTYVKKAMDAFGAPGLSLAVVEDGKTVVAKGYGVRSIKTNAPVDEHTAFPIGSESKAFTSAALAILVDRKKLNWTDRVVDKLPGFQMYDPYATEHMTIKDLLTHRSGLGLGEGDLLMVPDTNRKRADFVHALRYLKPVTGFREKFAYDNILYIVAGQLVQAVSGQTWEDFVRENLFKPAGMADAHANYEANASNAVALHARIDGLFRGIGHQQVLAKGLEPHASAPAGAINASAVDMANWMKLQLARGKTPDGVQVFSKEQADAMWEPVVVVPKNEFTLPAAMQSMVPHMQDYALGWFIEDYHGVRVVQHSGAVLGALAMMFLLPDKNVGISVTINSEDSATRRAVIYHLLDHYTNQPETDWIGVMQSALADIKAKTTAALNALPKPDAAAKGPKPSLPLAAYAGTYVDPWYGTMTVHDKGNGKLWITFDRTPGMEGALEPVSGDKFRTRWTDTGIEDAFVTFNVKDKKIADVSMAVISPAADFSFDYQDLHFVRQ